MKEIKSEDSANKITTNTKESIDSKVFDKENYEELSQNLKNNLSRRKKASMKSE